VGGGVAVGETVGDGVGEGVGVFVGVGVRVGDGVGEGVALKVGTGEGNVGSAFPEEPVGEEMAIGRAEVGGLEVKVIIAIRRRARKDIFSPISALLKIRSSKCYSALLR